MTLQIWVPKLLSDRVYRPYCSVARVEDDLRLRPQDSLPFWIVSPSDQPVGIAVACDATIRTVEVEQQVPTVGETPGGDRATWVLDESTCVEQPLRVLSVQRRAEALPTIGGRSHAEISIGCPVGIVPDGPR